MVLTPNFFIVGTPKSGTTSLFNYLEQHSEVFLPNIKEPHFFSSPEVKSTYYKATIIDDKEDYLNLYRSKKDYTVVADFSTSYLFNPKSARRIYEFNQNSKILIVLRNPVDRALSHYLMDCNLGYIDVPLIQVLQNPKDYPEYYKQYVELGFYRDQIQKYLQVFERSHVKIIISENFFLKPQETLKSIFDFLGVSNETNIDTQKKHNVYAKPKFKFIGKLTQSNKLNNLVPNSIKHVLKTILFKTDTTKPDFHEEKVFLTKIYKDTVEKTEKVLDLDLSIWKSKYWLQ